MNACRQTDRHKAIVSSIKSELSKCIFFFSEVIEEINRKLTVMFHNLSYLRCVRCRSLPAGFRALASYLKQIHNSSGWKKERSDIHLKMLVDWKEVLSGKKRRATRA